MLSSVGWDIKLFNQIFILIDPETSNKLTLGLNFKPTTQTQKHQIVNCGSEPTTRKNNPWVQTQKHQIVNSGFGPTLYCEQSKKKLILKSL